MALGKKSDMPRIDVLLPVYNVERYVTDALNSIRSQTFTEIEITIVDDCSTDNTLCIVEKIASIDPRIRVIRTPHNMGTAEALNYGLQFCRAPLIANMDGDDIALPTRLEKQRQFLEENPAIALVGCATKAIDQSGNPIAGLGISWVPCDQEQVTKTMLLASPCRHVWLARRDVYSHLCGYRDMRYTEDYDFLLRAITYGYRVSNLAEPLMLIRAHADNKSLFIQSRKAHYYIVSLYRERLKCGRDSFSREAYAKAVRASKAEDIAFQVAMRCLQKGTHSHSRVKRALLTALSAVVSPLQARYLFDRIRFRIAMRPSKREVSQSRAAGHVSDSL
jgi:glycosyltransferase involved in cell wall biosynthesis